MVDFLNLQPGPLAPEAIKPDQKLYFGLKGNPTEPIDMSLLNIAAGFTNIKKHSVTPIGDAQLAKYATTIFETSERRGPITGQSTVVETAGALSITRTSSNLGDQSLFEVSVPVDSSKSILASISFKKASWSTLSPDWCTATDLTGFYFGLEHGEFNTAAYAFLRDDGANGSVIFGGPLQAYNQIRGGQSEVATSLYGPSNPGAGWSTLSDGTIITIFLRVNTYTVPYTAELWTYVHGSGYAPYLQTSVPLMSLGTFPSMSFTNGRQGASGVARVIFGNLGMNGSTLEITDWRLYDDFPMLVMAGQASPVASLERASDALTSYNVNSKQLPTAGFARRWFNNSLSGYAAPVTSLKARSGVPSKPEYLLLKRATTQAALIARQEPADQPGSMIEAFMHLTYVSKDGALIGPGLVVNNASGSFNLVALNDGSSTIGLLKNGLPPNLIESYYTPTSGVDLSSPKLVRLITDSDRNIITVEVDDESVLTLPIGLANAKLVSGIQGPMTGLTGETLTFEDEDTNTYSHVFVSDPTSVTNLVSVLNAAFAGDFVFYDYGTKFGIEFLHPNKGFSVLPTGAVGDGALSLDTDAFASPEETELPTAPAQSFAFNFGFPFPGSYNSELRLNYLAYAKEFHEWKHSYLFLPDSTSQPIDVQFTLDSVGLGSSSMTDEGLVIEKLDFSGAGTHRFYKRNVSMAGNGSVLLDFEMQVKFYTDETGEPSAKNTAIGTGVVVYLGTKKLVLNAYECGIAGRRIGILPGSGSDVDILNQTALGVPFSAKVDWTELIKYRVLIEPYNSIKVWSGTILQDPIITIPWRNDTDGFDLPTEVSSTGFGFGHMSYTTEPSSATTLWKTIRWAFANGFDIGVSRQYPDGIPSSAFGGKALILTTLE